jgi:hypothetical protein
MITIMLLGLGAFMQLSTIATAPTNLFRPWDILLFPTKRPYAKLAVHAEEELWFHVRAYQDDVYDERKLLIKKANPLQLWYNEEDAVSALKMAANPAQIQPLAELLDEQNDNGEYGMYRFSGRVAAQNTMLSTYVYAPHWITLSFHLPIVTSHVELLGIQRSGTTPTGTTVEDVASQPLLQTIQQMGHLNLRSWHKTSVGDVGAFVWWQKDFVQARPLLKNVFTGVRLGMTLPTGVRDKEDELLGILFDSGTKAPGLVFGGTLKLWMTPAAFFGIDAQISTLFAYRCLHRVKTDATQTEHLLINKVPALIRPGSIQHFTLYGGHARIVTGLGGRLAYQFTKHQDDTIFIDNDRVNPLVAADAERLQEWTTHSVVFSLTYDAWTDLHAKVKPYFSILVKGGFNGKRALVGNSVTFDIGCAF